MAWTGKRIFKVTDSISRRIGSYAIWIPPEEKPEPEITPVTPVIEDIQGQIDDIVDSIENEYAIDLVFDQWQDMTTGAPFYFYWEIPLGTIEIISASISFEVKTGTGTINFTVSEDKGALYGNNYGPYTTDMRAIDITGDLTGEGIKIIKLTTSANVTLTARVFLRIRISKDETPEGEISERPEVKTLAATSVTDVSATLNGDIVSVGKGTYVDRTTGEIKPVTCTKRGFKYGLTMTDTWDTNTEATYVRGTFGISATSLTPETDYYFRAYADNQKGRSYGEYVTLTTLVSTLFETQLVNDGNWLSAYGTTWKAYFFQAESSHDVNEIHLYMTRTGSPGTITLSLFPNEGTGNFKPVIGGGALTTGTTNGNTLLTSGGEWRAFSVTPYSLVNGTWYSIVIKATSGNASNHADWWGTNDNILPNQWRHTSSDSGANWYSGQFECTYKIKNV